jgi:hypothetical protein
VAYRLIDPGSEWRLHRQWYDRSAMADLLGEDFDLVQKDNLYRCLDKLLAHKTELFSFLQQRWKTLFDAVAIGSGSPFVAAGEGVRSDLPMRP